jgi:hypothetical protein
MIKLFSCLVPFCIVCLFSCKNTAIRDRVSPLTTVPAPAPGPDAPPPGTPVLETPQAYCSYITDRQKKVYDYIIQMSDAATINPITAISTVNGAIPQIGVLTHEIKAMPPYKGNDAMRDAAVALFEFYEATFNGGYQQLFGYTQKGHTLTNAEVLRMKELSAAILTEEKRLNEVFKAKQQIFAEANHMVQQADLYQQVDYLK